MQALCKRRPSVPQGLEPPWLSRPLGSQTHPKTAEGSLWTRKCISHSLKSALSVMKSGQIIFAMDFYFLLKEVCAT